MMRIAILPLMIVLALASCRGVGVTPFSTPPPLEGDGWSVRFTGNATLPVGELRTAIAEQLAEFDAEGISKPGVDDAAYALEIDYRDRGFPHAYVDYDYLETEADGVRATFQVEEGARVVLERIQLEGADSFPKEELLAFFPQRSTGLFADAPRYYVQSRVADGVDGLRSFYRQSGYLTAEVSDAAVQFDAAGTHATAMVTVVEGPRFTLAARDVEWQGETGVTGDREERRLRLPQRFLQPDGAPPPPYTLRLAHSLRAQILAQYGAWGYPDCRIEVLPDLNMITGRVRLVLDVDAGPHVRLSRIEIRGNEKTRGAFIRTRLAIEGGEDYDSEAIRTGFGRLFATGLFETVTIELDGTTGEERVLVVTVEEAPSIELFVEPGYGSYEGPRLRFGAEERNVFGTGRSLRAEATVGPLAQNAKLGFLDRTFLRTDIQASTSVFYNHREEQSFTLQESGTGVELSRSWPRKHLVSAVGYKFRRTDLTDVQIIDPIAKEILEDVDIASVSTSLTRDTRDHPLVPSSGGRSRVNLEWASAVFGSEIDFLALRFEGSHFLPLPWSGGVLGLAARTGVIEPIADTDVIPLQQRYFNGGENTVRSFKEGELGPHDSTNEPLGGEAFTVLTAELRQELLGKLSGALFIDTGNVSPTVSEWSSFNDMRTAIGVGLRYLLPIGPLRVDAGFNPNPRTNEDDFVIHFSVGMSF